MEIKELSAEEYEKTYPSEYVYNSVAFCKLNREKVERIRYLSIGDTKPRFGIILGERADSLASPFSAPFGGFTQRDTLRLDYMDEAAKLVADYACRMGKKLIITPPALVYDPTLLSKWTNILSSHLSTRWVDLNYHFDLSRMDDYSCHMERNARKNLNRALRQDFSFVKLDSGKRSDVERAYNIIRRNREERGFPLRMTLEQVWQTVSIVVSADFFVLEHNGNDVAAAQVFRVSRDIAQVVYWGDIREYSNLRPMNMITYCVFKHYHDAGLRILDIGISTECGVPNFGLCEFKESIGCEVTLKYSFESKQS